MVRRSRSANRLIFLYLIFPVAAIPGVLRADSNPDFDVQAHRGGRALRPENTLAAFAHAVDLGADTLEMDLAITKDRVAVVSHDYRLNPILTRGPGGEFLEEDKRRID